MMAQTLEGIGIHGGLSNHERRRLRVEYARTKGRHTKYDWWEMLDFFKSHCVCCGEWFEYITKDHIVAVCCGGGDGIDNLQPLCENCNSRKMDFEDYRPGYCNTNGLKMPKAWKLKQINFSDVDGE